MLLDDSIPGLASDSGLTHGNGGGCNNLQSFLRLALILQGCNSFPALLHSSDFCCIAQSFLGFVGAKAGHE